MTKLEKQSEFTRIANLGGEKRGGLATGEGWMHVLRFG